MSGKIRRMDATAGIDWRALGEEAIDLLRRYLMIDTTNPPGNEAAGAAFLAEVLARDGIRSETVESAPGRANLRARLAGDGSLPAIVLHHHIDVVYADRRYWSVDPFAGVVRDGHLYGRGAIDMKSTGIVQLAAVLALKRAGARLTRDLVLLATADEEAGSAHGARFVADRHRDWLAGAAYALSEFGGIEANAGYRVPLGHIVVSEKTGLPLELVARSQPGHGSMPWPDTAPHRLVRALDRLLAAERPLRVRPEVQEYFARLASVLPAEQAAGYEDIAASLRDPAFRARFLRHRRDAAMVRTTFAVTMLRGSEKRNVIPPEASAGIDCRMIAGDEPDEIVAWVRRVIDDDQIEVTVVGEPKVPNLSPPDTEMYKALAEAFRRRVPDVVVAPEVLVGFTDNWVFRGCGLHGYGWSPFVMDESDWARVHGNDERISLENVREGARCYTEMLLSIAGA
jgi:acetylornithine deacetylase/succinyl-diaminopimelate desuccinylase-like protein